MIAICQRWAQMMAFIQPPVGAPWFRPVLVDGADCCESSDCFLSPLGRLQGSRSSPLFGGVGNSEVVVFA